MYENQIEKAIWEEGRRDGIAKIDARYDQFSAGYQVYMDGHRQGKLERLAKGA